MIRVKRDLTFAGFRFDVWWNERHAVRVGWVRVAGLLREKTRGDPTKGRDW
jgi:hypothetical protein